MRAHRYRWGSLAWLLTLQFFVVETIVQASSAVPYSRTGETISALGAAASPTHVLMNVSLVLQGVLIAAGLVLLGPALLGAGRHIAQVVLGLAAVGAALAGIVPQDSVHAAHVTGMLLYLAGGSLGLIGLAYAVRPRSELLGTTLAVLGVLATAMTVFFVTGVTRYLGTGGTERAAAYLLPVGLAVAAAGLWRLAGAGPDSEPAVDTGPGRRRLREEARAERARQAHERDAALIAAAARRAAGDARPQADPADDDAEPDPGELDADTLAPDELDPEDPWAPPRRRSS